MMRFNHFSQSLFLFMTCLSFLMSCGKIQSESSGSNGSESDPSPSTTPISSELREFLDKQTVNCGPDGCPDYINKIVVIDRGEAKFCTGFLTDTGTVATAASCLPDLLRFQGQNCENEIFFFFPATTSKPAVSAGCHRVIQASRIDISTPSTLWRENIAFLELDQNIYRRSLKISREGMGDKKKFDLWKVDQLSDKKTGVVRREECVAVHGTFMNPLASQKFSPNMVLGNCSFLNGNSGAPIIDGAGRLRGIANGDIDRSIAKFLEDNKFLEKGELAPMLFANNMACTMNIDDNEGYPDRECVKELSESHISRLRSSMVDANLMFSDYLKETREAVTSNNQFVNFDVRLIEKSTGKFTVQFYPRCFIQPEQWRNKPPRSKSFTVSAPFYELARGADSYSKLRVNLLESRNAQFRVDFEPRYVLENRSSVSIRSNVSSSSYPNIPSSCLTQSISR